MRSANCHQQRGMRSTEDDEEEAMDISDVPLHPGTIAAVQPRTVVEAVEDAKACAARPGAAACHANAAPAPPWRAKKHGARVIWTQRDRLCASTFDVAIVSSALLGLRRASLRSRASLSVKSPFVERSLNRASISIGRRSARHGRSALQLGRHYSALD